MTAIIIILWVLCGIITAVIASEKGHNGCGWLLIGCLLGVFGVVLAIVVSPNVEMIEAKKLAKGANKKCPSCAELVKVEAVKCRHCGEELEWQPEEPEPHKDNKGSFFFP